MPDENGSAPSDDPTNGSVLVPSFEGGANTIATPGDVAAFEQRFLRLIERRTAIYTMGDSTSVPTHVALDLLQSVCFVLGIDPARPEIPERLLFVDLEEEFGRRLAEIERKVERTGELWRDVNATMTAIPNIALRDTLAAIGDFPRAYDFRSMAHEIPVVFDYPLCHSVPETLVGVDYVNEYLRRLLLEADFLRRFGRAACERALASTSPDYIGLLVNLYEPPAVNAIGLALTGRDPRPLLVSDEDRDEITRRLGPLGAVRRSAALRVAAMDVCRVVGVADDGAQEYLLDVVPELLPRIDVALERGDLRGVFPG